MFCAIVGIRPPRKELWEYVRQQVTLIRTSASEDDVYDDDGGAVDDTVSTEWRDYYSLVQDEDNDGAMTLLAMAICASPATPEAIIETVQQVIHDWNNSKGNNKDDDDDDNHNQDIEISCELWASAPAPLPLRPLEGYRPLLELDPTPSSLKEEKIEYVNQDTKDELRLDAFPPTTSTPWIDRASLALKEWGLVTQSHILDAQGIIALRTLVDEAIQQVDQALATHRPELVVGQDVFCFQEIASRNKERFDLRLTQSAAGDFVTNVILGQNPQMQALVQRVLSGSGSGDGDGSNDGNLDASSSSLEFDFDISVVYSRPGACAQGWHADGNHQKGALDAGWTADGWKTQLAPAYALCLFVPLIDLNDTVGFTQFWPASHRYRNVHGFGPVARVTEATYDAKCRAGDGIWYDYRLFHQGMPNTSLDIVRPVLQVIFKKKWYVEKENYGVESIVVGTGTTDTTKMKGSGD